MTAAAQTLKKYFNAMPDKENEEEIVKSISAGVSFHGATLWVLVFAIFIASLGLNVNSTAVIIGAMLISPLMGPIIGMGLAVGINDIQLLKRAYTQPYQDSFTDDASVVDNIGQKITLIEGNRENIKITTPFDLRMARILV